MTAKTPQQIERAYELLDFLKNHPDSHDQEHWLYRIAPAIGEPMTAARALNECGTTACAAGWTVLLAGGEIVLHEGVPYALPTASVPGMLSGTSVHAVASRLLGLTQREEDMLFWEARNFADVADVIEYIFGPQPVTP
jgi:hypothetical protein